MAGYASYDDLINQVTTNGKSLEWDLCKYGPAPKAAGVWTRLWSSDGFPGVKDSSSNVLSEPPANLTLSAATNATPIVVTTGTHNLNDGQSVNITGVVGNTAANGDFYIRKSGIGSATTFGLYTDFALTNAVAGNGAYTSGGTVNGTKRLSSPMAMRWADQSPAQKMILTWGCVSTQDCVVVLHDRISDLGAISINATGDISITTAALARYTTGVGVEPWLEVTTGGTGTPQMNLKTYVNDGNTTSSTGASVTFNATPVANSMYQLPLVAGDLGVRSVSALHVTAAGTGAVVNLALLKPLAKLTLSANMWNERDFVLQLSSLPVVNDGASLMISFLASGTTAPNFKSKIRLGYA